MATRQSTSQLRLFHTFPYSTDAKPDDEEIVIECRVLHDTSYYRSNIYRWRCQRCGQGGASYPWPREDLLEWARANHVCRCTEECRVANASCRD